MTDGRRTRGVFLRRPPVTGVGRDYTVLLEERFGTVIREGEERRFGVRSPLTREGRNWSGQTGSRTLRGRDLSDHWVRSISVNGTQTSLDTTYVRDGEIGTLDPVQSRVEGLEDEGVGSLSLPSWG